MVCVCRKNYAACLATVDVSWWKKYSSVTFVELLGSIVFFLSHRWICRRKRWSTSCLWRSVPYWLHQEHSRVNKRLHNNEGLEAEREGVGGGGVERTANSIRIWDRKRGSRLLPHSPDWWGVQRGNTSGLLQNFHSFLKRLTCASDTQHG